MHSESHSPKPTPPATVKPTYRVALALVRRGSTWLVARRHDHVHLGGLWEFPGGKCEPGETARHAALRELHEECGVEAEVESQLAPIPCEYADRHVILEPVLCQWRSGEGAPLGSQECRWVTPTEMLTLEMPEANARLRAAMGIA